MMNARKVIGSLNAGSAVFASEIEVPDLRILDMLVAGGQVVKCETGEHTWYIAYDPKPSESASDKANQMAKAIARR